jgi:hypothetical protein
MSKSNAGYSLNLDQYPFLLIDPHDILLEVALTPINNFNPKYDCSFYAMLIQLLLNISRKNSFWS